MLEVNLSSKFINLTEPGELASHLPPEMHEPKSLQSVASIAQRISSHQLLSSGGKSHPMIPELLSYVMHHASGQVIVDLGAGSGEEMLLAAAAGATVYINDISEQELQTAMKLAKTLPPNIYKRIHTIAGDCFELQTHDLEGKVGILICRNLIQYANTAQQNKFFAIIAKLLQPQGQAFIITEADLNNEEKPFLFNATQVVASGMRANFLQTSLLLGVYEATATAHDDENVSWTKGRKDVVYSRSFGAGWVEQQQVFQQMGQENTLKIKQLIKEKKEEFKSFKAGLVSAATASLYKFGPKAFALLSSMHGLQVQEIRYVTRDYHLLNPQEDPRAHNPTLICARICPRPRADQPASASP